MQPPASQSLNKPTGDTSLIDVLCSLNRSVLDMSYAVGRLHFTLDAGHEDFEQYVKGGDAISVSSVTQPTPAVEGSPVIVPCSVTDPLVHMDTMTQYVVGNPLATLGATLAVDNDSDAVFVGSSKPKWYAITVGREPGVVFGSQTVMSNVSCIPGGNAFPCGSEVEAKTMFDRELEAGRVVKVEFVHRRTLITREIVPCGTYVIPK